jgi:hypothetical protein
LFRQVLRSSTEKSFKNSRREKIVQEQPSRKFRLVRRNLPMNMYFSNKKRVHMLLQSDLSVLVVILPLSRKICQQSSTAISMDGPFAPFNLWALISMDQPFNKGDPPQKHRSSVETGSHDLKGLSGYKYIFPSLKS